jgi:hypothetical protein
MPMREVELAKINIFGSDGAKWSASDWYDEVREQIIAALAKGPSHAWTTGWYGVKKEIQTGRITCLDGVITCEAGVSDDLDTEGRGSCTIRHTADIDAVSDAMDEALRQAHSDQRDNRCYVGYSIHKKCKPKGLPLSTWWIETYLAPLGDGHLMDRPPGDNYRRWGWQGEGTVPADVRRRLELWIHRHMAEMTPQTQFTWKGYRVKPWEED